MPNWTNSPPPARNPHALSLLRVTPEKQIQGIVTAEDMLGCHTHYWKGRTTPCEGETCEPCKTGHPSRWHAYLPIWSPKTHHHVILELTAAAAETVTAYKHTYQTLRGCLITARRKNRNPNSQLVVECKPADINGILLPTPPDVVACMSTIWSLPKPLVEPTNRIAGIPTINPNGRAKTPRPTT
jgi:hypothetical protein